MSCYRWKRYKSWNGKNNLRNAKHGTNDESFKILELNPTHEVFEVLKSSYSKGNYDELSDFASLLYYQSALSEGIKIENPSDVAAKINSLIIKMGSRI